MAQVEALPRPVRSTLRFAAWLSRCHDLLRTVFDPYRPERHYMRGPGPKCREKHDRGT